ncbi:MAG: hypothetical protein A3B91_04640 [Candidatus Yanofskybacteria bacterium RIFCSPHIGHO2_02_FULL_41_29]|nr:MAG: hypothetical protein A3B91_04640 [Candidatus Yanofskybacteria bacterium RIFCSPHIGHO2_02_FULL_41_29]
MIIQWKLENVKCKIVSYFDILISNFMNFTRKDLTSSLTTGLYAGVIVWQILNFLKAPSFGLPTSHPHSLFIIIIPVVWVCGVNLGYFLGRWMSFFNQFGKFAVIGFTNFIVYSGILNILIAGTDINAGLWYPVFIAIAFVGGALHSYGWNKFWVFESGASGGGAGEFAKFFIVNGIAGLVNVGIASFVVNVVGPLSNLSGDVWANVGAVAGSAVALIFSFIGFRLVVFKKKEL